MFDYIKGILDNKMHTQKGAIVTVEAGGLGYLIETTAKNISTLPQSGAEVKIYTVLLHREDSMSLCGFVHREERDIFKILTSVSGVGVKMALTLLDEFDSYELISYVIKGDYRELTRAKGVGPKLAQKIILELKDKLIKTQGEIPIVDSGESGGGDEQALLDVQSVLLSLGYERSEIKSALSNAVKFVKDSSNPEDILKEALRLLSA